MGDFPEHWNLVKELPGGGQGHTFVVRGQAGEPNPREFVFKRLINPKRVERFRQEIEACKSLDHPNIMKIVESGTTPKGRPYLISEYYSGGSLESMSIFAQPLRGMRFFKVILDAIAFAHSHKPAVYHLDLKPANVFLKDADSPVVGDFGICFIEGDAVAITSEGQHGSAYYCAPELRGPRIEKNLDAGLADVYSLGKLLYWLFTAQVYDGSEDDYSDIKERALAHLYPEYPQFAFVDEIVAVTVQKRPSQRPSVEDFVKRMDETIKRMEAGGRVLDLRIPQTCLYCGKGKYQVFSMPPSRDRRSGKANPSQSLYSGADAWSEMRSQTTSGLGMAFAGSGGVGSPVPIHLICDYCGNVQQFRVDRIVAASQNWLP